VVVQNWRTTRLWKLLLQEGRSTDNTRSYIASWLDDVEILLAKSNTAPMDFTLHDHDHSYRVAERMASLLSANTMELLSDFEIGMLLMSAYLHDVGMNPNRSAVRSIRDFLFTGASEGLENSEAELLQRWLDETYPGVEPPVGQELDGRERLHYAEYLTAYFCRHRHNDWSEKFINERAARSASPPYPAWTDDLILLCKSHHYGLTELLDDSFNLRVVGSGHKLVNLRYLAAALRLSDVLDFDPERTPSVIVSQRSVDPKSHIHWHKDHDIALTSDVRTGQTLITARTPSARIQYFAFSKVCVRCNHRAAYMTSHSESPSKGNFGSKCSADQNYVSSEPSGSLEFEQTHIRMREAGTTSAIRAKERLTL
jgi:hypothetical protein